MSDDEDRNPHGQRTLAGLLSLTSSLSLASSLGAAVLLLGGLAGSLGALGLELGLAQALSLLAIRLLRGGTAGSLLYCVLASDLSLVLGGGAGLLGLAGSLLRGSLGGGGLLSGVSGGGLLLGGVASGFLLHGKINTIHGCGGGAEKMQATKERGDSFRGIRSHLIKHKEG